MVYSAPESRRVCKCPGMGKATVPPHLEGKPPAPQQAMSNGISNAPMPPPSNSSTPILQGGWLEPKKKMQRDGKPGWGPGSACQPLWEGKRHSYKWQPSSQCISYLLGRIGIAGHGSSGTSCPRGGSYDGPWTNTTDGSLPDHSHQRQ